ncbi:MAG: DUF5357 family protein [Coleofasciculus sp. D1-CHI-01]|uniref:DUF5357 family protein n=1 Tax=Coleofasciculus sp. D1-CHI-01 TaxID=3068482 RepID=UPI0032F27A1D
MIRKILNNILNWVNNLLRTIFEIFNPDTAFSWQTLIGLSVFSWAMSFLATNIFTIILASFSWWFLILGVYWATTSNKDISIGKILLSPWITGALVTIYIVGIVTGELPAYALVIWPLISAIIAALPTCLGENFKPKIPDRDKRQPLVWLFTSQLILSSWFQFYFLVQDWLVQYPTIAADTFEKSAFVVRLSTDESRQRLPRGTTILDLVASRLEEQLNNQEWSDIEQILLLREREQLIEQIDQIATQVRQEIASPDIKEDNLWKVRLGEISLRESGYNLELKAFWEGPRSQTQANLLTKSCQIISVNRQTDIGISLVSQVECDPVEGWRVAEPIVTSQSPTL